MALFGKRREPSKVGDQYRRKPADAGTLYLPGEGPKAPVEKFTDKHIEGKDVFIDHVKGFYVAQGVDETEAAEGAKDQVAAQVEVWVEEVQNFLDAASERIGLHGGTVSPVVLNIPERSFSVILGGACGTCKFTAKTAEDRVAEDFRDAKKAGFLAFIDDDALEVEVFVPTTKAEIEASVQAGVASGSRSYQTRNDMGI